LRFIYDKSKDMSERNGQPIYNGEYYIDKLGQYHKLSGNGLSPIEKRFLDKVDEISKREREKRLVANMVDSSLTEAAIVHPSELRPDPDFDPRLVTPKAINWIRYYLAEFAV